jgi:hypothetical protein
VPLACVARGRRAAIALSVLNRRLSSGQDHLSEGGFLAESARSDGRAGAGGCHLQQCACGSFRCDLDLRKAVDAEHATAGCRDGVLRIEILWLE